MTTTTAAETTPFTVDYGHVGLVAVHFDDLDAMGVVHNARYALLLERAMITFWNARGYSFVDGRPTSPDSFNVVKEYRITYHTPIRTAGDVAVHLWTDRVGETSSTYGFRILSADGSTVHAEGIRVVVKLDPATMRPVAWTPEGRAIADGLARVHTRPAV